MFTEKHGDSTQSIKKKVPVEKCLRWGRKVFTEKEEIGHRGEGSEWVGITVVYNTVSIPVESELGRMSWRQTENRLILID